MGVVIHTTAAEVYERLWCVYEIDAAMSRGLQIEAAMSLGYLTRVVNSMAASNGYYVAIFYRCRHGAYNQNEVLKTVQSASCSRADDERVIRGDIEKNGGYERLAKSICDFRSKILSSSTSSSSSSS